MLHKGMGEGSRQFFLSVLFLYAFFVLRCFALLIYNVYFISRRAASAR